MAAWLAHFKIFTSMFEMNWNEIVTSDLYEMSMCVAFFVLELSALVRHRTQEPSDKSIFECERLWV